MRNQLRFLLMIMTLIATTSIVDAADTEVVDGVAFARTLAVDGQTFDLLGAGIFRYRVVFRAYAGALYVGRGETADGVLRAGVPLRLELEYFWPIRGDQFADAAWPFLKSNLSPSEYEKIRERADQIGRLFADVEPGDRMALTFLPGQGTTLTFNGAPLGTIAGDDFAALYFQIWLGEQPISARFRDLLLARR